MAQVADQLAVAVGGQWNDEAAMRRLNDPYPLPVSWAAADPALTDAWESLVKLATSGAGWPAPTPAGTWAAGPDDLAGEGGELVEVLARVPTGRLVVLGEPGAGKTMLMVRLVLDLLARRASGGPVPFLTSVASWNPADQDLRDWLRAQLVIDHPALAGPPSTDMTEPTLAEALLASGLILPVLDGLDEIPEGVRASAISRINDALRPGEHLVSTCRSKEYRDAVRPRDGAEVTLRAAAVQLRPLDADVVRGYLCDDAAGPVARARWDPVLAVLGTDAPAGQALDTPLTVGLARAIYNPRPGELAGTLRDPADLCDPALADRIAVKSLLLDAFIPAAYRHDTAGRWKAHDAERWLVFLARHLERKIGDPDLAWWQLPQAIPDFALAGVMCGAIFGAMIGAVVGVSYGVVAGIVAGVLGAVVSGTFLGAFFVYVRGDAAGQSWAVPDLTFAASPQAVLTTDRIVAIVGGAISAAIIGIPVGVLFVIGFRADAEAAVVAGAIFWFALGTWFSFLVTAWPSYEMARISLALRHRLPWSLREFLADAHRRGVLRQAGAVYQFRHIELQRRLAARP